MKGRRGAFMLLQMLITISLLSAFVIVADRVFRLSLLTTGRETVAAEDAARLDRALAALRADVWSASTVEMLSPTRLSAGGAVWAVGEDGTLTRTAGAEVRRFDGMPLRFEWRSPLLTVSRDGREVAVLRQAIGGVR